METQNPMSFYDRAALLGHDAEALRAGQTVTAPVEVADIHALKALVNQFPSAVPPASGNAPTDLLSDRVRSFVYGAESLADDDHNQIKHLFPLQVSAVSVPDLVLSTLYQVPQSPTVPVFLNFGKVTFNAGGYVVSNGTQLNLTADEIVVNAAAPAGKAHFNIFGIDGPPGGKVDNGGAGGKGGDGNEGECSSAGIAGSGGTNGTNGTDGSDGPDGRNGNPAYPSQATSIIINTNLTGTALPLTVFTRSGSGGSGGRGGDGGKGGNGGNGGNGRSCGCTGNGGGGGANGGKGGDGGDGGNGSNAVDGAGAITVTIPSTVKVSSVFSSHQNAVNGIGGTAGIAAGGGTGGKGGSGGKHSGNGGDGGDGGHGTNGTDGISGQGSAGNPTPVYINGGKPAV